MQNEIRRQDDQLENQTEIAPVQNIEILNSIQDTKKFEVQIREIADRLQEEIAPWEKLIAAAKAAAQKEMDEVRKNIEQNLER